jgi:hypothetical protein
MALDRLDNLDPQHLDPLGQRARSTKEVEAGTTKERNAAEDLLGSGQLRELHAARACASKRGSRPAGDSTSG